MCITISVVSLDFSIKISPDAKLILPKAGNQRGRVGTSDAALPPCLRGCALHPALGIGVKNMPNEFEERPRSHVGDKVTAVGVRRSALDKLLETIIFEIVREREMAYRSFDEALTPCWLTPICAAPRGSGCSQRYSGRLTCGALIPSRRPIPTTGPPASRAEGSSVASSGYRTTSSRSRSQRHSSPLIGTKREALGWNFERLPRLQTTQERSIPLHTRGATI